MKIDDTTGDLRRVADHLFDYVARPELAGQRPALQGWKHCYKAQKQGHRALYFEIVGPRGILRQNAIKLNTAWSEPLGELSGVQVGNGLHGADAAELWVFAGSQADLPTAEEFIRRAING